MNSLDIQYILRELHAQNVRQIDRENIMFSCIQAQWTHEGGNDHKPSCGVKINTSGLSPINCFTCGGDTFYGYVKTYGYMAVKSGQMSKEKLEVILDFIQIAEAEVDCNERERLKFSIKKYEIPERYFDIFGNYTEESKKIYDRFIGSIEDLKVFNVGITDERLIFPIYDTRKELCMVSGRWIGNNWEEYDEPKYKHIPAEANKSHYLYGEHLFNKDIKKVIITEGHIDVVNGNIALKQAGLNDYLVVGLMGSKPSDKQIEKIKTISEEVVACLDGDMAGRVGQYKLKERLENFLSVSLIQLPEGKDLDNVVKSGDFLKLLNERKDSLNYDLEKLLNIKGEILL